MRKDLFVLVITVLLASGCAFGPTPYKPHGRSGGYSELRLGGNDMFLVKFEGNVQLDILVLRMHLLRRASELTVRHGYTYFEILQSKTHPRPSIVKQQKLSLLPPIFVFWDAIVIKCFREDPGLAFHAANILASLESDSSHHADRPRVTPYR